MSLRSWLSRIRLAWRVLSGNNDSRFWSVLGGDSGPTDAGVDVTEDTALNFSAVYRAVALIAGTTATLPIYTNQRLSARKSKIIEGHRVEKLLGCTGRPNENMDGLTYRETTMATVLTAGNSCSEITHAGGEVVRLFPLNPARVRPWIGNDGAIEYKVRRKDGTEDTLDRSRILHVKNIGGDGLWGWSTIRRARQGIGLGLATEKAGASLFGNGIRATGAFKTQKEMKPKAAQEFLEFLRAQYVGMEKSGRPMLLYNGLEWDPFTIDPNDAQYLQTRQFQIDEIARWFGIPPHLLASLLRATNNNIEHQGLEFLHFCLRYWLVKLETAYNLMLLTEEERRQGFYVAHDTADLLKGDMKSRFDAYKIGREAGFLSVNMILEREDENTIGPEGELFLVPANMKNLASLLDPPEEEGETPAEDPAPEGQPKPEEKKEPEKKEKEPAYGYDEETDDDDEGAGLAHRDLLIDALERLTKKEHKAVAEAAARPGNFVGWLEGFYTDHAAYVAETVRPALAAWLSLHSPLAQAKVDAGRFAAELAAAITLKAKAELLDLAGAATAKQLPAAIAKWALESAARPTAVAEDLRGKLPWRKPCPLNRAG